MQAFAIKTDHKLRGRHGHDGMVAGLQKHVQSVPIYKSCEFESWQGVLDTLSDKVCQLFSCFNYKESYDRISVRIVVLNVIFKSSSVLS
jgi:predicted DNA binding CopG/RHH family protein